MLIHDGRSNCELIFVSAQQHMLISDSSLVLRNYFDSNIVQSENAWILGYLQMHSFEADVARIKMFTSDVITAGKCMPCISNVICHKFSYGAASYTLNGKNVNIILEEV